MNSAKWGFLMSFSLFGMVVGCASTPAPKGNLVYCSYSNKATAGGGYNYSELINEKGETKVVIARNLECRFAEPEKREYVATPEDVEALRKIILDSKMYKLDGYSAHEDMTGGTTYRVHVEFDSGQFITFSWYSHNVKAEAVDAYDAVEAFFSDFLARQKTK